MKAYAFLGCVLSTISGVCGEAISPEDVESFRISSFSMQSIKTDIRDSDEKIDAKKITLDARVPLQKTVQTFLEKNSRNKLGMVIGRGNVQGVAEERIMLDSLKGLKWLFVDPGDAGAVGYLRDNDQDEMQGNALKTTWPLSFSLEGQFDAVVFDYGTLQYIGDDGTMGRSTAEVEFYKAKQQLKIKFNEQTMNAYVEDGGRTHQFTVPESGVIDAGVFAQAPYRFDYWLDQNNPPELVLLTEAYASRREREKQNIHAARHRQRETLKRGLRDAYVSLKPGGTLIIPIDGTLNGIDLPAVLGVSEDRIEKYSLENLGRVKRYDVTLEDGKTYSIYNEDEKESPILPENQKGMGATPSDIYIVTKGR